MNYRRIVLLLASISVLASTCADLSSILPGSIFEIDDVVLSSCQPYVSSPTTHQCLIVSNPGKKVLRVFDATSNQFVLSPLGYSTLAVQLKGQPTSLAKLSTDSVNVYALDSLNARIETISTQFQGKQPSFVKPTVSVSVPNGVNRMLGLSSDFLLQVGIDQIYKGNTLWFTASSKIYNWAVDSQLQKLALATEDGFSWVDIATAAEAKVITGVAMQGVAVGWIDLGNGGPELVAIAFKRNSNDIVVVTSREQKTITLSSPTTAGYIPEGNRSTCCNNTTDPWAAVLTTSGDLEYINLKKFKSAVTAFVPDKVGFFSGALGDPIKLLGVEIDSPKGKQRKMFLFYPRFIASVDEGESEKITKVDSH